MKVFITVDPEIPVPPELYGGIERIVDFLIDGLTKRGIPVTLFAHSKSRVPCTLVPWRGTSSQSKTDTISNAVQLLQHITRTDSKDLIVHSFARLAYLLPFMASDLPKIQSYQRKVTPRSILWGSRLSRGSLHFSACSRSCADSSGANVDWHVIPNGVRTDLYHFSPEVPSDAPLVFLGRLEKIKGPHHAVTIARKTGRRLIVAGNLPSNMEEREFIEQNVLKFCDGEMIRYVGAVNDRQKNEILRSASALLFPIEWEEPFGIVMTEALACGTPVIALHRGACPEVVIDGQNGFLCSTLSEMVDSIPKLPSISRSRCREITERRFSAETIVEQYLSLYHLTLNRRNKRSPAISSAETDSLRRNGTR